MSYRGYWADLPAHRFNDLPQGAVAVLPLGATEQHGPHLPLSVDSTLVDAVVARALPQVAQDVTALVLPTVRVSKSDEHDGFAGTLSLSAETLLAVLRDTVASVARTGVERVVFFNGHGGNTAVLEIAARAARIDHGLIAAHCSWFGFAEAEGAGLEHDIHAGYLETSAMLAARPELVEMAQARDFRTAMADWAEAFPAVGLSGQPVRPGWIAADLNADGACGNAAAATAEEGQRLLDTAARGFAAFLGEFARFDHRRGAP